MNKLAVKRSCHARILRALAVVACLWWAAGSCLLAQEALRMSLAGQDMAERRKLQLSEQKFNIELGPVSMRLSGAIYTEATDNVRATDKDREGDLSIRPQVNLFSVWRVTEMNSLTFGLGLGYTKYLHTSEYDKLFISPDTDLSFDVYAGDFLINFHDRFAYLQDVSSDPTVSGTGSLNRFDNTAGILVTWDLNKAVLTFGYDHVNLIAVETQNEHLTHSAELFTTSAGFALRPTLMAGIAVGGGLLDYDQDVLQDNEHIAAGPFVQAQLSEYTSLRIGGGYVVYSLDTYGNPALPSRVAGFYCDALLRQRLGNLLAHTFSFGRNLQSGIDSDLVELWHVRSSANWNLFRKTGLTSTLSYEHAKTTDEILDRYGFGFTLSRPLTKHLTGSLGYQFYLKDSDLPNNSYLQNRLMLNLAYTF